MICHNEECNNEANLSCTECNAFFCDTCVTDCGWTDDKGARCDEKMCFVCRDRSKLGICGRCNKDRMVSRNGPDLTIK